MHLGTAKGIITPAEKVRLAGYAARTEIFDEVKEDIWTRVFYFREKDTELAFIYGDVLWWGSDFISRYRDEIAAKTGVLPQNIIFIASHNHSGPPTGSNFTRILESEHEAYSIFLQRKVIETVNLAKEDMEKVAGYLYQGESHLNVYRRVTAEGGIMMRPNYDVPADRNLKVIQFRNERDEIKGMMVHFPCHANISSENNVHPDFAGVALRILDEKYPGSISMYLQGAAGDLRPNVVLGDRFLSQNYERAKEFAGFFAEDVEKTLGKEPENIQFDVHTSERDVKLKMNHLKSEEELTALLLSDVQVQREYAEKVLEKGNRDYELLKLKRIDFGKKLTLVLFNCELSQDYAYFLRSQDRKILAVTYADGMIGYVCTAKQIAEGGYEPSESALYFALAGNFIPESEEAIHNELKLLLRG